MAAFATLEDHSLLSGLYVRYFLTVGFFIPGYLKSLHLTGLFHPLHTFSSSADAHENRCPLERTQDRQGSRLCVFLYEGFD